MKNQGRVHQNCRELGPPTAKLALLLINTIKYGIIKFLLYVFLLGKFKPCIYTKHSLLIINVYEQHRFVYFSG